jgi:hypothetical protein
MTQSIRAPANVPLLSTIVQALPPFSFPHEAAYITHPSADPVNPSVLGANFTVQRFWRLLAVLAQFGVGGCSASGPESSFENRSRHAPARA